MLKKLIERLYFSQKGNLALYDQFTGCLNRNWFERFASLDKSRYIYVCDINGLKKANDTMGHAYGDLLIKSTADKLISTGEKVCRYGGDEFYVFADTDISNKLKKLSNDGQLFSFGGCERFSSIKATLEIADEAMYNMKKCFHAMA